MRDTSRKLTFCLAILAAFMLSILALPSPIHAQSFGSIVGTVTDSSGAAIPGTTITLTNIGTGDKQTTQSDAAGNYRFLDLNPANYKIEAQKNNFKRFVRQPVTVQVASATRSDVSLQVGAVTETVQVTSQAPLLNTESGTLGSQVEGKTVQEMPLNGRNTMNLIALVPGVVPQGSTAGGAGLNQGDHTNNSGWGNYQIGGSVAGHGVVFVDGAPNNSIGGNTVGFIPTQDAIQEFKVSTSAISPEFGRFGGGVVEMTTKSGTNSWHGTTYEFFRNTVLDSNTYGQNQSNAAQIASGVTNLPFGGRQKLNQNQYGGVVDGPVKKDKIFFMFAYEGYKIRSGLTDQFNIPDAGMMSDTDPSVPFPLTDPSLIISNWTKTGSYGTSGTACTEAFNKRGDNRTHIDPNCVDPASKLFKEFYPDVNQPASPTNPIQYYVNSPTAGPGLPNPNYRVAYVVGTDTAQYNARGDVNLSPSQRLFVRYSYFKSRDIPADEVHSAHGFLTANAGSDYFTHQGVLGDTYTINPTTIADVRLSILRNYGDNMQASADQASTTSFIQSLGAGWAPVSAAASQIHLPKPQIGPFGPGGKDGLYTFRAMGGWSWYWNDLESLSASITKIKGNHTLKFGGELRFMDQTAGGVWTPDGQVGFSDDYAGEAWANFLLSTPDSSTISTSSSSGAFNWYQGYYASDTWAVSHKLTVSGGLRWELPGGIAERKDRNTVLLPDYQGSNGILGTLALVNSDLWKDRTSEPALHNLFSPRIGFAYRVRNDTVVRGGYSLVYLPPDMGGVLPGSSPIVAANTGAFNPPQNPNPVANPTPIYYTMSNPFGSGANAVPIKQPTGRTVPSGYSDFASWFQSSDGYQGQGISGPVPTNKLSYMQQWNLAVGQQFKGNESVEIGYAGALAVHLLPAGGNWGLDQPNQNQLAQIAACTGACNSYQYMPFPNYHNVTNANDYNGTINYNSMQVRYEKRFGNGATITSGYTWSKSLGDSDTTMTFLDSGADGVPQDYNNIKGEHSILSYSIAHRWVTSYILNLPFGRGKMFANSMNGTVDRMIGGWSLEGITTIQSGNHIMLVDGSGDVLTTNYNAGQLRPDYLSGCDKMQGIHGSQQSRLGAWFNTACFAMPDVHQGSPYALGSESRVDSSLLTSGIANWDFTAQKTTRITEKTNVEFRMEFYNLFNRRQWNMPNNDVSSGAFGSVQDQQNNPRQMQASLRFSF